MIINWQSHMVAFININANLQFINVINRFIILIITLLSWPNFPHAVFTRSGVAPMLAHRARACLLLCRCTASEYKLALLSAPTNFSNSTCRLCKYCKYWKLSMLKAKVVYSWAMGKQLNSSLLVYRNIFGGSWIDINTKQ